MKKASAPVRGMTLIELIVVVAMVAILSIIAYPNFSDYQLRARRMDAKMALEKVAALQERFYATNLAYTPNLTQLGITNNLSDSGFYQLSVPTANMQEFRVSAVPAPGSPQERDLDCQQFAINNLHLREALPDPDGKCW